MLERLNVFLRGCDGKGAQDGDYIETLNYYYYYYYYWLCSECSVVWFDMCRFRFQL